MALERGRGEAGRALELVLASVAVVIAVVALIIALTRDTTTKPETAPTLGPTTTTTKTVVPVVAGMTQASALNALRAAGLQYGVSQEQSTDPVGVVVLQTPKAGTDVPRNSTVAIVVSSGAIVPTFPGTSSSAG